MMTPSEVDVEYMLLMQRLEIQARAYTLPGLVGLAARTHLSLIPLKAAKVSQRASSTCRVFIHNRFRPKSQQLRSLSNDM